MTYRYGLGAAIGRILQGGLMRWRSRDTGHRLWPGPLFGALIVGACAGALSLTRTGDLLEQRFGLWTLFQLRGATRPPSEVVIIAMPRNTGDRISVPRHRSEQNPCADL